MDFPKLLHIQVTEEDIERAKTAFENNPGVRDTSCPIAQAVTRMGYRVLYVSGNKFRVFSTEDETILYYLPERAQEFITFADEHNDEVNPFKFMALRQEGY